MIHATIYHYTHCSKSRKVQDSVQNTFRHFHLTKYQKQSLNKQEIKELLYKLKLPAEAIIRKNELVKQTQFTNKLLSEAYLIEAKAAYPALMERSIVVCNNKG